MGAEKLDGRESIIIPLDVPDLESATFIIDKLIGSVGSFKIGRQAIDGGYGHAIADYLTTKGQRFLWDSKMADIPNTSGEATKALKDSLPNGVWAIDIHVSSGHDSIKKMVDEAAGSRVWAVTLLTSITPEQCGELFGASPEVIVLRWSGIALRQEVHGIICSPKEIEIIRGEYGYGFEIITPGVRLAGSDTQDQVRTDTPGNAIAKGASHLVIGRPITKANDPVVVARAIAEEIEQAFKKRENSRRKP